MDKDTLSSDTMIGSLTQINNLFDYVLSSEKPEEKLQYLLASLTQVTNSTKCQLIALNDNYVSSYFCDNCNDNLIESKFGNEIKFISLAVTHKEILLIDDISKEPQLMDNYISSNKINSLISIPLITKNKVFALLCLENPNFLWFKNEYFELLKVIKNYSTLSIKGINLLKALDKDSLNISNILFSPNTYDTSNTLSNSTDYELDLCKIAFENIKELFCFTSFDGTIMYLSPTYKDILGLDVSNIYKNNIYEFIGLDYRKEFLSYFKKVLNNVTTEPFKCKCINSLNKTIWLKIHGRTYNSSSSDLCGIIFVAEDITDEVIYADRIVKETKEQEVLKNEFFATISHELRTPINIIYATLQMLDLDLKAMNDIVLYDKFGSRFKSLKQNCFRLMRLINNIIDVTKIDAGYFNLNLSKLNIVSLIEEMTLSVANYVEIKNLDFIFDTDLEERVIACDPEKIERILLNLISNAVKYTPSGGTISVMLKNYSDFVQVSVKDTGKGIPEKDQICIFDRFIQSKNQVNSNVYGSGIGLSLVKSLVELHGGTISLSSSLDNGSEFVFTLPNNLSDPSLDYQEFPDAVNGNFASNNIQKIKVELSDIYM